MNAAASFTTLHHERQLMEPSWAIVELMGHVRIAGRVSEEERFGAKLGRIDIPNKDGGFTTQFFSGSSIYRMTPCSEEAARAVAIQNQPAPVHSWEMPKQIPSCVPHDIAMDLTGADDTDDDQDHEF